MKNHKMITCAQLNLISIALVFLAVISHSTAADPPMGNWPTQASGMNRNASVSGSVATRRLQIAWETPVPGFASSPAVVDGRIYYTENDGRITCLDAGTGAQIWQRSFLPDPHSMTPPTVVGNRVLFGRFNRSADSQVIALNVADGVTVWSKPIMSQWESYGAPCVFGGRVFMGGGTYGGMYGHDLITGAQLFFNSSLPQVDGWTPTQTGGELLTWLNGTVRRHAAATGQVQASAVIDVNHFSYGQSSLVAATNTQAVMISSNGIFSVNPATLATQWTVAGSAFTGTPTIAGDSVFVMATPGIQSRSASTGALLATSPDLGLTSYKNNLIVTGDAVVVSAAGSTYNSTTGSTWILDRNTLALRQKLPIGGSIAVAGGALFVADESPARMIRLDLLDASLDANANITVRKNGIPQAEGATVSGNIDVTVSISNAIGQHVQIYGNFMVLQSMDHDEMIETSPWETTVRIDTRRFFDGENLLSVHVHPHNHHEGQHSTDFTFATFKTVTANSKPAPSGDRLLPQFQSGGYPVAGARIVPAQGLPSWTTIRGGGSLIDDGVNYGVDQFPDEAGPIQIISHLGTSVLGRARWHLFSPPFGDLELIADVDARPFLSAQPKLSRIVYFFTDRAGRANYYTEDILLPAQTPADLANAPLPLMHGHVLNLHDGDHLVADDANGFTVFVKVVSPMPHADRYRSLTLWIGNRAVAVVSMQTFVDAIPPGGSSCIIPVVIPSSEIAGLLAARDAGEGSRAFALWMDFNSGDKNAQIDTLNMPNSEHLHLNSVRLASTPWTWGAPSIHIVSPYEGEAVGSQPLQLRYRKWGNLSGVNKALVSIDGGPAVIESGFDDVMPLPVLSRGAHSIVITLANSSGVPLTAPEATSRVDFVVPNRAPKGTGDAWRTNISTTLSISAANGVLANDSDPDADLLTASLVENTQHGTFTLSATGAFTYVPQAGFRGVDRFSYRASDGGASTVPLVALILVGCDGQSGVTEPWTTLGNGPGHAGVAPGSLSGRQPIQRWSYTSVSGGTLLHATIADGRVHTGESVYFGDGMQALGLSLSSGAQLWQHNFANGNSLNPQTFDAGRVYFQRGNHGSDTQLWSLDASNGNVVWQAPFGAQFERYLAPCVADGKVFINGGYYGGMYGFRQSDGAQLFFANIEQFDGWTPTWNEGRLYTNISGHLRLHNQLSGELIKQTEVDFAWNGWTSNDATVAKDGMLVIRNQFEIAGFDAVTLQRRWRVYEEQRFTAMPSISDRLVYVPLSVGGLEVRSLDDGSLQRTVNFPEIVIGQPIICNDLVIVANETTTRGLDRATFETVWTLPVGGFLSLGQDHLCVTSGAQLSCYQLPKKNNIPIAVADVFSTSEDTALVVTNAALLANDSDADGNVLTVRVVTQPTRGTLTFITGGHTYQPAQDAYGVDSFTYVANDGLSDSPAVTVTINVTSIQDPLVTYKPGLLAEYFDFTTALTTIPALNGRVPEVTRTDNQIAYASVTTAWAGLPTTMVDTFASRHSGWLKVDTAGSYTVFIKSDDGSRLFLNGALVINNDGAHGMRERSAVLTLPAGYHRLMVEFFEGTGGAGLEFRWSGPGIAKQLVPASALWQAGDPPLYRAGLQAEFFDYVESLSFIPDLSSRIAEVKRTDSQINYPTVSTAWTGLPTTMADTFASRHGGWLKVDTQGSYTLYLSSNEGSKLYLNGQMLINNDGLHDTLERSVILNLAPGFHQLRVEFFENIGSAGLSFRWAGPGITKRLVPASALWHTPTGVIGVPPPWISGTVGVTGITGSAVGNGADFSISGGGSGIGGTADSFHFVYQPLTSNGEMIARVAALQNTNSLAKAGVMLRTSTDANSANVFMSLTPTSGAIFQARTVSAAATSSVVMSGKKAPNWVRLVRIGTSVTGWISSDGITWTQVGAAVTVPLGATPVIGLGVTSANNATRALAIFDQVIFIPHTGG